MNIINFLLKYHVDHIVAIIIIIGHVISKWKFIKDNLKDSIRYIRTIWFFSLYIILSIYCIIHWQKVIIVKPLTGNFIMLCSLIVLSFLPFIAKLKIGEHEGILNDPFDDLIKSRFEVKQMSENTTDADIDLEKEKVIETLTENVNATERKGKGKNVSM